MLELLLVLAGLGTQIVVIVHPSMVVRVVVMVTCALTQIVFFTLTDEIVGIPWSVFIKKFKELDAKKLAEFYLLIASELLLVFVPSLIVRILIWVLYTIAKVRFFDKFNM